MPIVVQIGEHLQLHERFGNSKFTLIQVCCIFAIKRKFSETEQYIKYYYLFYKK